MKRYIIILILLLIWPALIIAQDARSGGANPDRFFYSANANYAKGDYAKAVENYVRILDLGIENGEVYYNLGNCFLKLGKAGYAILCYEKAMRYIPGDSDLKANMNYARSFMEAEPGGGSWHGQILIRAIEAPFRSFNLNTVAAIAITLYLLVVALTVLNMTANAFAKKLRPIYFTILVIFFLTVLAFGLRYYKEEFYKRAVVIQKEAEARYEPIEKSTPYYKVYEGQNVVVLKTESGWRQIRRSDGKSGWIKKEAAEEV